MDNYICPVVAPLSNLPSTIAIADGDRINLVIRKGDKGYKAFVKVIDKIGKQGFFSWYGDIVDENGKECDGLVITNRGGEK